MRVAVVTANIGGIDVPHHVVPQTVPADWTWFTDDPLPQVERPWEAAVVPWLEGEPRLLAKRYRMPPFTEGFDDYDFVVWLDASTEVTSPRFLAGALTAARDYPLTTWAHPVRDCVYEEATVSLVENEAKYGPVRDEIEQQMKCYREVGYPEHNGLYATGTLVWNMHTACRMIGGAWLHECEARSYHDQLSLPYVAWRLDAQIGAFPFSQVELRDVGVMGNRWLRYHPHTRTT